MQEVQTTLPIGTILRGRYVVESLLGKGGFGAVYLVRDQRVKGNLFALKEMVDSSKQERARFAFECEVLKRVDHRSLPRVYYVFEDSKNSRAYMLMDYIEGPNLETLRQKQPDKRFTLPEMMNIMSPIMEVVSYLHSQMPPVIHRDIKPANIIVPTSGDQAMLVDLGIAKEYDPESTTTAVRRCSPGYGAPEQYSRGTNIGTDIYGLGATCYTLLTGYVPEDAFYRMTQIGSNGSDPLEPVNKLVPGIPPLVAEAIQRAMAINSKDRFPTVEKFWQALNAYPIWQQTTQQIGGAATPIPAVATPMAAAQGAAIASSNGQPREDRRKSRGILLLLVLLLLALIGGLGFAAAYWPSLGRHAVPAITPATGVLHRQPTAPPNSTRTAASTATTKPSPSPTTSPSTVLSGYPQVAGTHNGQVHNTTATPNIAANMTLSLKQNQGQISGNVTIYAPLLGSGSIYNGSVGTNNFIQFTVTAYASNGPLKFTGTVNADGSMQGTYCSIDSAGNCNSASGGQGTWNVGPGPSGSGSSFILPASGWQQAYGSSQDIEAFLK